MQTSSLQHRKFALILVALLMATAPAAAQVRAPGNDRPLPESAQKAPPLQQGTAGPRMLAGTFVTDPSGSTVQHDGFSARCEPAGARGSSFTVNASFGSSEIRGLGFIREENLFDGQFILIGDDPATPAIEGRFHQIAGVHADERLTLTAPFFGDSGQYVAKREMLLFTTCNVTLDDPAAGGTIVISARGNQPGSGPGERFLPAAIVAQIEQGAGPLPAEGSFQFFLMSPGFPPHNPGATGTVDFIAIGN